MPKKKSDKHTKPDEDDVLPEGDGDELPWGDIGSDESDEDGNEPVSLGGMSEEDEDDALELEDDDELEEQEQEALERASSFPCPNCGGDLIGRKTHSGDLEVKCTSCDWKDSV